MKQLIMLLFACVVSCGLHAQTTAKDTVTNAGTVNISTPANYFNVSEGTWSAGIVVTKLTGTTAGTAILQASIDGTNFTNLYGDSRDSFTLANTATQVKHWFVAGVKPKTVRVRVVGTGTQSTAVQVFYIKNQN